MACGVLSWRELVRIPHTRPVFVAVTGPSQGLLRVCWFTALEAWQLATPSIARLFKHLGGLPGVCDAQDPASSSLHGGTVDLSAVTGPFGENRTGIEL